MYMSNEQVEQIRDTHVAFLERQLRNKSISQRDYEQEMRELERWTRKNTH